MVVLLETDVNARRYGGATSSGLLLSKEDANKKRPVRVDSHHSTRSLTSSTRLRSNLLRKLGIPPSSASGALRVPSKTPYPYPVSLLGNVKEERIPLKTGEEEYDDYEVTGRSPNDTVFHAWGSHLWNSSSSITSSSRSSSSPSKEELMNQQRRVVRFDPQVSVVPIPSRHEYSKRIGRFLWDSPEHMVRNVVRNTLEFRADGWDWETVLEEKDHYYSQSTREYIHPIHLEIADMTAEEQTLLVPANYVNPALAILTGQPHYY